MVGRHFIVTKYRLGFKSVVLFDRAEIVFTCNDIFMPYDVIVKDRWGPGEF